MLIGELARRTGASPKAIRLYEARKLLPRVPRKGAYRVYGEEHVQQIQVIRQAQVLGFTLTELGSALKADQVEPDWETLLQQLDRKKTAIRNTIRQLEQLELQVDRIGADIRLCLAESANTSQALCEGVARTHMENMPNGHP
ncbi:DNA-binding transcriptional regulator, MerR family [Halopseudomonas salegens]|uniref:DNA-binding transcriptional regulator, MerR family n=1 Tax=Halopseudomonas salegens TaxID=1434072 RepID=A0A1H2G2W9_9GAMM|nr:DNA-binding transcriptional regulator, MerR family [Halopseudomonas salegens]